MNYYAKIRYSVCLSLITLGITMVTFVSPVFSQELKIITYNIRYDNPNDGKNAWTNRKEEMVTFLKDQNADLMGFQEVLSGQMKFLKSNLGAYQSVGVGREDGKNKGEFSPVFFKKDEFELIDFFTLWLSETPDRPSKGWDAALERIATFVKLKNKISNQLFIVVNTHFDHVGVKARTESSKLILRKIDEIFNGEKVVFMGDLNSEPATDAVQEILKNGFSDSFLCDSRSGPEATFSGFENTNYNEGPRIDYIFLKNWSCQNYTVLTPMNNSSNLSDHLPVKILAGN